MSEQIAKPVSTVRPVELPAGLKARVNQLASRRGKEEAELVRVSTLRVLQQMANEGIPLDQLAEAFKGIEADGARKLCHPPTTE